MRIHLVGGFLGSGKTTAIINAAKLLMARGQRVGIVTNDQGRYLVDTAFVQLAGLPAVEVSGGCFCCNYDDFTARVDELANTIKPDVIFAESVGSCADLVATVMKPMLELRGTGSQPTSLSVFTDSRLLRLRLSGEELPFNDDVNYIFDQQIAEASLLVINKADLLPPAQREELLAAARAAYPDKQVRLQDSRTEAGVQEWLDLIESSQSALPTRTVDMDYQRYGQGEARLAWVDERFELSVPPASGREVIARILSDLQSRLTASQAAVGHLKVLVEAGPVRHKASLTTLAHADWLATLPDLPGEKVQLLVNARVEMPAEDLSRLVRQAVDSAGVPVTLLHGDQFHPAQPVPTHRIR